MAEPRPEGIVLGEVQKPRMAHRVAVAVVPEPHRLGPVVEDLPRHPVEVLEGLLVAEQEGRQSLG
jgi:hypothetical protein